MTIEGVDFSWARLTSSQLKAAGKHFACRYLPYSFTDYRGVRYDDNGKGLSADEARELHAGGIALVLNFESAATRAKLGKTAGIEDGKASQKAIVALGLPTTLPVYFSGDWDTTSADYNEIDAYLGGAASVLGKGRVGIYGEYALLEHCYAAGSAAWFWQTYAWSGGKLSSHAHLYQYHNGQTISGQAVDFDRAMRADYGQWPAASDLPPESDTVGELLMDFEFKGERFKPNATHPDGAPYRAAPDRSLAGIGTITDTFRSGAEIVDGSGQAWRATKKNGQTVFILRADLDPIVLGGEPAVDADLDNFFAGVVQDCSDEVTAERKRIAAAEAARIEAI